MTVTVLSIHHHFTGHQTLVKTLHKPNWFEWLVLFRRAKQVYYLGHKSKWYHYPGMKPVTTANTVEELAAIELKGQVLRGNAKHTRVPVLTFKK